MPIWSWSTVTTRCGLASSRRPKVVLHGTRPVPRTHTGKIQRRKMQPWFAAWSSHRGQTVLASLSVDDQAVSTIR